MFTIYKTRCDAPPESSAEVEAPPPKYPEVESFESKAYRKFTAQPLVPIGCAVTAYFLVSGIKSFQDRNPVRSQKMMQYRVGAQFVTLLCFIGYVGLDSFDLRIAPMYQEAKKAREEGSPPPKPYK